MCLPTQVSVGLCLPTQVSVGLLFAPTGVCGLLQGKPHESACRLCVLLSRPHPTQLRTTRGVELNELGMVKNALMAAKFKRVVGNAAVFS